MNLYDDILCEYKVKYKEKSCHVNAYCKEEAFIKAQKILKRALYIFIVMNVEHFYPLSGTIICQEFHLKNHKSLLILRDRASSLLLKILDSVRVRLT